MNLRELVAQASPVPLVVSTKSVELDHMVSAANSGACGCISASIGIDMLFQAAKLTSAGGIFLATSAARSLRTRLRPKAAPTQRGGLPHIGWQNGSNLECPCIFR